MSPVLQHLARDWQTWITLAIGVVAAAHLWRRWGPHRAARAVAAPSACHSGGTPASSTCSSGCGQCGSSANTAGPKDHRIHIVRR